MSPRFRPLALHIALIALSLILASQLLAAEAFTVPGQSGWATWEAEQARSHGDWHVAAEPSASGAQLAELKDSTGTLEFPFEVQRATTLQVKPLWGRDGERASARRYPYPMERLPGPDAVDTCGGFVFFTAPAAGRVGIVDAAADTLAGSVEVGGYLTDLVADRDSGTIYVADAADRRIVTIDAESRKVTGEIRVRREPWSLALGGGKLYVACRAGQCVCVIDTARGRVISTIPLVAPPISVELVGSPLRLLVRFQQQSVNVLSLDTVAPDRAQYPAGDARKSVRYGGVKTFDSPKAGQVRVTKAGASSVIDVVEVTGVSRPAEANEPPDMPGPDRFALCGDLIFFTAPDTGRVGVVDAKTDKLVKQIAVGGQPVDIVVDAGRGKVYVADALVSRVTVIDAKKLEVAREIKTPAQPCSLELVGTVAWQRDYMVPRTPVDKLFVACRGGRTLAVVDVTKDEFVKELPLPAAPRRVRFIEMPNPDWWPLLADDRIAIALTPRVAVELEPLAFDLNLFVPVAAPEAPAAAPRHNVAKLGQGDTAKSFQGDNDLVLKAGPTRQLDVTAVADPQLSGDVPLTSSDAPGTLTFSLDGGPEFNWTRDIWLRPDNKLLLVNGSDDFWRWNAPRFEVGAGQHVLTVRARGGCVALDGIGVQPSAEGRLSLDLRPEPWKLHSQVPLSSYQGVFYDTEPIRFTVRASSTGAPSDPVTLTSRLKNYMDEEVAQGKPIELSLAQGGKAEAALEFAPQDTGRFTLTLTLKSREGEVTRDFFFLRLPKLEHPRMFFRPEDVPAMEQRIAQHPRLFARYADWLKRMSQKEGKFPDRFLPNGLTQGDLAKAAPATSKDPGQEWGWRMYELGFRLLAMEFAARYIPGADSAALDAKMKPLLEKPTTDYWVEYHHHGPFFPGAVEGMVDMAPAAVRKDLALPDFFRTKMGDINVMPWTLMSLEEPLSPKDRALVYQIAAMQTNFQHYFEAHAPGRGGLWWQNPWSWCYCPTQGIFLGFMFSHNVFGEPRLFEKPFFRGILTFMEYADPLKDKKHILPSLRRPSGEPWRWILTAVARQPVEKDEYGWDEWIKKLDGDLPQPEQQAVDDLMGMKGMKFAGPLSAAPHHFATGVAVPVALALGWYDPAAPTVKQSELPPTTIFPVEGWVPMRSGWDDNATEVTLMCGVRDHTTRHQPNNLNIVKAGEFMFGTPSTWADDGNCTPAWGNTVVAGDRWIERWTLNLQQPRAEENAVIDRFSPAAFTYISRDRRLSGYSPAEGGWGGGVDLHGHTETLMQDQGKLLAYETRRDYDYAAGDASNAWPTDELRRHFRQVVFLKPDVIVIYDRVTLAPGMKDSRWVACTAPGLKLEAPQQFWVKGDASLLYGQVLYPRQAVLSAPPVLPGFMWKGQQMLEIRPADPATEMEYLVALKVGGGELTAFTALLEEKPDVLTVTLPAGRDGAQVSFNRTGAVGGQVTFLHGNATLKHDLAAGIADTYANWTADPRFEMWTKERRFDFVIPDGDRK